MGGGHEQKVGLGRQRHIAPESTKPVEGFRRPGGPQQPLPLRIPAALTTTAPQDLCRKNSRSLAPPMMGDLLKQVTPSLLLQVTDGYYGFKNRFGLKNIKITRKAETTIEEAAATFSAELK